MAEIVVTEFMDQSAVDRLAEDFDVLYDPDLVDAPVELAAALGNARALVVRNRTRVDEALLTGAPELVIVARLGVGLDNIDVAACGERGIRVAPATGANTNAVSEYVIGALHVLFRGIFDRTDAVIAGTWPRRESRGRELAGKQLGLLGFGLIAREVAGRARALGMEVAATDPHVSADDPAWRTVRRLDRRELFATCDAVSIHVPLVPETTNLVDAGLIGSMKRSAVLVNTSRGGVADEEALIAALREHRLAGAAIDVFVTEPLDAAAGARFTGVPNLLLTPHIAGITVESDERVGEMTVEAITQALAERS